MNPYMVSVETKIIQDSMTYEGTVLLIYKIQYPEFYSEKFRQAAQIMSTYYKVKAMEFQRYCRNELFGLAVEQYKYSKENDFPVMQYEADVVFQVTYNQNCTLSLYFDQYIYSGGAHGGTTRYSDTWNLKTKRRMSLSQFFPRDFNYKEYILKNINEQIKKQIETGDFNYYFEDYQKNTAETFNPNSFYLKPQGIVIYYQQYDIAAYAAGILEFLIPFENGVVIQPKC